MPGTTKSIDESTISNTTRTARLQHWMMPLSLLLSDTVALSASWILAYLLVCLSGRKLYPPIYFSLWPIILLFLLAYLLRNLYSRTGRNPAEELKRTTWTTLYVYFFLIAMTFFLRGRYIQLYSRSMVLLSGFLSVGLVPLCRSVLRSKCSRKSWWGTPVLILGAGKTGQLLAGTLRDNPSFGLKVAAILDDDPEKQNRCEDIPVYGRLNLMETLARKKKIRHVLICMPGISRGRLQEVLNECSRFFPHVTIIPDLFGISSLWVTAKDLGGVLTLDIQQNALSLASRLLKRVIDITLTLVGGILILPILAAIAIKIKKESPGPVLYGQRRIGKNGKMFTCWKFRSMHVNADKMLQSYLDKDPQLRSEWEATQKLRNDPRVSSIGKFLRKTSLDELPQLWNVLMGDMSLVGPRPIVTDEIDKFGKDYVLYKRAKPGITGYWQVSGRTDTTYEERVRMERYYVSNWSIWLDIYILAKTVSVVLNCEGAY